MVDLPRSTERTFVEYQFVHSAIIAEMYSPMELWKWKQKLELLNLPNLAITLLVDIHASPSRRVSHRQKFTLREQVTTTLRCAWPQMLANWHEDLECILLVAKERDTSKEVIVEEVSHVLCNLNLPFATTVYAGISRVVEGPSWLPAAVHAARTAAKHGYSIRKRICHEEELELADEDPVNVEPNAGTETAFESDIRAVRRLFQAVDRRVVTVSTLGASLETSKRSVLEALVGLVNHARVQGVPADEALLGGTSLFSSLLKITNEREFTVWIETTGNVFLHKLADLADQTRPQIIQKAIEYIIHHLHEDLELEKIATHCLVSHYYLSHLFRKETGMTVTGFIKKTRMDQAMELLKRAEYSIADVAYRVGYQDPNYFSKSFRTYIGTTPTEFRRSLQPK